MQKVTAATVRKFVTLEAARKKAEHTANQIKREVESLRELLIAHVESEGGKRRELLFGRTKVAIVRGKGSIAWKQHFIRRLGETAAARIKPPLVDRLEVERV